MKCIIPITKIFVLFSLFLVFNQIIWAQRTARFQTFPFAQNPGNDRHPHFSIRPEYYGSAGNQLWLAYDSEVDSGNTEVFLGVRYWDDNFWGEPIRLTFDPHLDQYPVVGIYNDENPLVVWETNRRGNFDLMFAIFDSSGWSESAFITKDLGDDCRPELFSIITGRYPLPPTPYTVLVWERDAQLFCSRYAERVWQSPEPISPDTSVQTNHFIFGDENRIWLVWESNKYSNWDIFGSWLNHNSTEWASPQQLTRSDFSDRHPVLIFSGGWVDTDVILVWQSDRDDNEEIYARNWWKEADHSHLSNHVNLTDNDSADVEPYGLFIPWG